MPAYYYLLDSQYRFQTNYKIRFDLLIFSVLNHSVPLVPWNCQQASICKDLKFLQLLHKLGFHMPVDTGKVFIRIPHFWTPDCLYEVAGKISPIDICKSAIENLFMNLYIFTWDFDM